MNVDIHKYSIEDYILLKTIILDAYKTQTSNQPFILEFLEHIIKGDALEDTLWINHRTRNYMYKQELKNIPRFINHDHKLIRIIIKWRLQVAK
jgi:hypothetical protein